MSGHQYVPNPANLFTDEDEIDDELFLRNARRNDGYLPADDKYGMSKVTGAAYTRPDVLGPTAVYDGSGLGGYAGSSGSAGGSVVSVGPGGYVMDMPAAAYGGYGAGVVPTKPLVYGSAANMYSSLGPDAADVAVDDEIARQRQTFEQRRRELEESTLLTSQRCLGVLRETEQVGIATAEELHRQREQLEKTKKQLDEINNSLRFSQKHLNSLKSVFGGLKNYLSGRMVAGGGGSGSIGPGGSVHGGEHGVVTTAGGIPRQNISSPTPTEEDDLYPNPQDFRIADPYWTADQSPVPPPQGVAGDYHHHHHPHHPHHPQQQQQQQQHHHQQQQLANGGGNAGGGFSHQLDQNLDEMRGNLSRLKNLALDLNQEIDSQNDLIDDISDRVEDVDVKIGKQNKDMNRLMRK
ncbi:synaptosomal-associated protein 29 [Anopheles marshallii]|uniref:synaptosomal-associated protein 29 n=1 Tax=Anopheles marshallii TaxID=1521116 RepID=UPI00237AA4B3|nr:synaptosomal-associated protein 29 [Anopheles marshallii]